MKKSRTYRMTALILVLTMCLAAALTGCGDEEDPIESQDKEPVAAELSAPIKIAAMKGPTGMGLAYLMDQPKRYEVTLYQRPDEAAAKLLSGEADIAAVSSNLGPVLYNKTQGDLCVLAVNTGGISYIAENGPQTIKNLQDLRGKTLIASGKGSTQEYLLTRLLSDAGLNPETDVDIQWLGNHSDASAAFLAQPGAIAMLPEPFVSMAVAQSKNTAVDVDLNELWEDTYKEDIPMGIFVARKSFVEQRAGDLAIFMRECDNSAERVEENPAEAAEIIAAKGIIENVAVAQKAIPRCNIMFEDGKDAKEMLIPLYNVLLELQPNSIGGGLPAEDYYYMPADRD